MHLSLVVFSGLVSPSRLRELRLVGAPTENKVDVVKALEGRALALGEVAERSVLAVPALGTQLDAWVDKCGLVDEDQGATLIYLDSDADEFALIHVEGGVVLRRHSYVDDEYLVEGVALPIENVILSAFKAEEREGGLVFIREGGDVFEPAQVGDALLQAVLEEALGDLEELQDVALTLCDPPIRAAVVESQPAASNGGTELLQTLAAKEQLELSPDADLAQLGAGVEPFLAGEGESYKRADALIEWLIDQPGVEEVYIATEHLAKLLARW